MGSPDPLKPTFLIFKESLPGTLKSEEPNDLSIDFLVEGAIRQSAEWLAGELARGVAMTVITPTITGYTAVPYTGAPPCGYMRPIHHHCKVKGCPLQGTMVMVLAPKLAGAIEACHRLWHTRGKQLVSQRYEVRATTFNLDSEDLEEGLLRDDPDSWSWLRSVVEEQEMVIHLSNIGALLSPAGSAGRIWVAKGQPLPLPQNATPGRPEYEHISWLAGDLDSAGLLIDETDDEEEDDLDFGEPSKGL